MAKKKSKKYFSLYENYIEFIKKQYRIYAKSIKIDKNL